MRRTLEQKLHLVAYDAPAALVELGAEEAQLITLATTPVAHGEKGLTLPWSSLTRLPLRRLPKC